MAKRYYLCPVIGTGQSSNDPFRAKVQDYGVDHVAVIPTDPITGHPLFAWCLAVVSTANHAPLIADAQIDAAPDAGGLDVKWGALGAAVRGIFRSRLQNRYGFTTSELGGLDNADSFRDAIGGIGKKLDGNFDANNFDVG